MPQINSNSSGLISDNNDENIVINNTEIINNNSTESISDPIDFTSIPQPTVKVTNTSDNNPDSKDIIALMKVISDDNTDKSYSDIPRAIAKIVPTVIEKLVKEYEELYSRHEEIEQRAKSLTYQTQTQRDVFTEALNSDSLDAEKLAVLPQEARNIVRDYVNLRTKVNEIESKLSTIRSEIARVKDYIDEYGLRNKEKPSINSEFDDLMNSVDRSLNRISENVRVNLYGQISSALSSGHTDSLPSDLLDLINHLVIERLESILRPYEELSAKYVSGELTHDQFTNLLSKNALLSLLREKVIEDIIREYENNNLTSPIIPMRLRLATERMITDAKSFAKMMSSDNSYSVSEEPEDDNTSVGNFGLEENNQNNVSSGSFSLEDDDKA
ncbi:MAG: hypothetical protein WCJ19_01915 [bacterium]